VVPKSITAQTRRRGSRPSSWGRAHRRQNSAPQVALIGCSWKLAVKACLSAIFVLPSQVGRVCQ
jgi:hypothetical protein